MKKQFLIIQGDPDELSPYSRDNLVELECGETAPAIPELLEKEMAAILRDVIEIETGEKVKYPIKLALSEEVVLDRLVPRTEDELVELAKEREVGGSGYGPHLDRGEAINTGSELSA